MFLALSEVIYILIKNHLLIHADAEESVDEDLTGSVETLNPARVDVIEEAEGLTPQEPCGSHETPSRIVVCRSEGAAQEPDIISTQNTGSVADPMGPGGDVSPEVFQVVDSTQEAIPAASAGLAVDSSEEASNQDGSIAEPPIIP